MTKNKKIQIEIVEMSDFFLYLPIDYAISKDFFNYIDLEKYSIKKRYPQKVHTDDLAYKMLMSESDEFKDIHFAICDPMVILNNEAELNYEDSVIVGALIKNYAFWAINHRTHKIKQLCDLAQYNNIICFNKGTTSYSIANHIYESSKDKINKPKKDFIVEVNPAKDLHDELMRLQIEERGAIALSPNILGIDSLIGKNPEYNIDFSLTDVEPYSDTVVTAILTRKDVIEKYPDVVEGLIKSISHAIFAIKSSNVQTSENIIQFATDNYTDGERASGGIEKIRKYNVYPDNLSIQKQHWERMINIYCIHNSKTNEEQNKYNDYYKNIINNKFANKSQSDLFNFFPGKFKRLKSKNKKSSLITYLLSWIIPVCLFGLFNNIDYYFFIFIPFIGVGIYLNSIFIKKEIKIISWLLVAIDSIFFILSVHRLITINFNDFYKDGYFLFYLTVLLPITGIIISLLTSKHGNDA